jgi:hypothetical protein
VNENSPTGSRGDAAPFITREPYASKEAWLADYIPIDASHMLPETIVKILGQEQENQIIELRKQQNGRDPYLFAVSLDPVIAAINEHIQALFTEPGQKNTLTVGLFHAMNQESLEKTECNPATLHPSFIVYHILTRAQVYARQMFLEKKYTDPILWQGALAALESPQFIRKIQEGIATYLFEQKNETSNFDLLLMRVSSYIGVDVEVSQVFWRYLTPQNPYSNKQKDLLDKLNTRAFEQRKASREAFFQWFKEEPNRLSDAILRATQTEEIATITINNLIKLFIQETRKPKDCDQIHTQMKSSLEQLLKDEEKQQPKKEPGNKKKGSTNIQSAPTLTPITTTSPSPLKPPVKEKDPYRIHNPILKVSSFLVLFKGSPAEKGLSNFLRVQNLLCKYTHE